MASFFTAVNINKSFHLHPVLKDVSFSLATGETVLLFGRNGSGKTTLLRILAGIMRPERGTAYLNGSILFTADSRWRRDVVYLGHQPNLYPAFTARENLMLSVRLRGQTWDEETFQTLLSGYGLAGREEEPIRVYSEGMLQRLGLVRLELASWRLALLDEPSAALDVDGTQTLSDALTRWHSQGRTVFFTSHDLGWGAARAERALLLSGGTISREAPVSTESDLVSYISEEE
ncbi:MAG: heme ABC exporter ATP-binding protein CcmA [Fidelibacterota bacterium]|nr:MAG: heme ABC exporter ATP-binding protein CcmA [Candidatus Neomarinimicrobiota bacterium]